MTIPLPPGPPALPAWPPWTCADTAALAAGLRELEERLLTGLRRRLSSGRTMRPDDPHPFARDPGWPLKPLDCWCGRERDAPAHAAWTAGRRTR